MPKLFKIKTEWGEPVTETRASMRITRVVFICGDYSEQALQYYLSLIMDSNENYSFLSTVDITEVKMYDKEDIFFDRIAREDLKTKINQLIDGDARSGNMSFEKNYFEFKIKMGAHEKKDQMIANGARVPFILA